MRPFIGLCLDHGVSFHKPFMEGLPTTQELLENPFARLGTDIAAHARHAAEAAAKTTCTGPKYAMHITTLAT